MPAWHAGHAQQSRTGMGGLACPAMSAVPKVVEEVMQNAISATIWNALCVRICPLPLSAWIVLRLATLRARATHVPAKRDMDARIAQMMQCANQFRLATTEQELPALYVSKILVIITETVQNVSQGTHIFNPRFDLVCHIVPLGQWLKQTNVPYQTRKRWHLLNL